LLIYKRSPTDPNQIESLNIVMKGVWRIADKKENSEDFIFKRVWAENDLAALQQQLNTEAQLKQLFYDKD